MPAKRAQQPEEKKRYRVNVGLNYPDGQGGERRAEEGAVIDDMPDQYIQSCIEQGYLTETTEPVTGSRPSTEEFVPVVEQ